MPVAELNYEIECRCGAAVRGQRLAVSQALPCPACGRPVFILPMSPLPAELLGSLAGGTAPEYPALKLAGLRRFWLGPLAAGLAALAVVGVVIASIVSKYRPTVDGSPRLAGMSASAQWQARLEAAQSAVSDGAYRIAANELDAAASLRERFPFVASNEDFREFRRRHRQVALLADLTPESIEEIMRHSLGQPDKEWQAVFRERYAGKAVILDARFFREISGRFHVDYQLEAAGLTGEWDVQSLALLERLSLQSPQRLLIGMRLAEVVRTSRDAWAVRPQPDSGVLFTDESLLGGLSIMIDSELREVLRRQAEYKADD
jgi:hypothetical protein